MNRVMLGSAVLVAYLLLMPGRASAVGSDTTN